MSVRWTVLIGAWIAASCGEAAAPAPSTTSPGPVAPAVVAAPSYALHEWGMLAYSALDADQPTIAVGSPVVERGRLLFGGNVYKPVIYVQLGEGTGELELELSVRAAVGSIVETYPRAHLDDGSGWARWTHLRASGSGLDCHAQYPAADHEACRAPSDGICEAMNARDYEASDGACLTVGEPDGPATFDHLLYRAATTEAALPVRVEREGEGFVVRASEGAPALRLFRIQRVFGDESVRAVAFEAPIAGGSMPLPEPTETTAEALREPLLAGLVEAGLTAPERAAFVHAWRDAIYPEPDETTGRSRFAYPERRALDPWARPPRDALYYWLPPSSCEAMLPISASPPPTSVRRALLVRIALADDLDATRVGLPVLRLDPHVEAVGIPAAVATRTLRRNLTQLRFCVDQIGLEAATTIAFTVHVDESAAAHVARLVVTPGSRSLEECMTRAFERWTFAPASAPDATVSGSLVAALAPDER